MVDHSLNLRITFKYQFCLFFFFTTLRFSIDLPYKMLSNVYSYYFTFLNSFFSNFIHTFPNDVISTLMKFAYEG